MELDRGFQPAEDQTYPEAAPAALPVVEAIGGFATPQGEPARLVYEPYLLVGTQVTTLDSGNKALIHTRQMTPGQCVGT